MDEILPAQKVTFRFRPTEQMLDGIKTIEPDLAPEKFIYPDDFKLVVSEYEKSGKKIVIVTDRVSKGDVDRGELGSGYEADNYDKVLSWCMNNKSRKTKIGKVFLFNWPFAWLSDAKKAYKAYEIFYQRFVRFIEKVKPDTVVVCGPDVFEFIAVKNMETLPKQRWRHQMNRVLPITIGGHSCQIVGTIDMLRPLSWDNKNVKDFPNLIGYLARGILAGFEGKNRYTVTIPQDKKFIYVNTIAKVKKLLRKLRKAKRVSIDTEGASLNRVVNQLYSIQFAFSDRLAYFLPMDHPQSPFKPMQLAKIKTKLREYFENAPDHSEFHIFQNAKYDLTMFHSQLGVRYYSHRVYDVQAGEFSLDENRKLLTKPYAVKPYSLDFICEQYGCDIYLRIPFSKGNRADIAREGLTPRVIDYGCYDVIVPWMIVECQIAEAERRGHKKFLTYVTEQLSDTVLSFAQMEFIGVKMDRKHLFSLKAKDGPLNKMVIEQVAKFKESKAAQRVNNYIKIKKGVPQGADLFGGSVWLFDIDKDYHQQLLFFKALKLDAIAEKKNGDGKIDKAFQEEYKKVPEVGIFNRYKKLKTIQTNFVNALYSRLEKDPDARLDSRIRARFDYLDVTTSRTCLDGNTPVYVLDDRAIVPIKKIREGDWVWAYNDELQPVPAKVTWQGRTKFAKTMTVMYQGSRGAGDLKTIICTPCHRFRLRDGSYVKARDLKPGDRLLALERKYNHNGYRNVYWTGMPQGNARIPEHRLVKGLPPKSKVVHHENEIKDDNRPDNLTIMSHMKHYKLHGYDIVERQKLGRKDRPLRSIKNHSSWNKGLNGDQSPTYKPLDKKWALKVLYKHKGKPTVFRDKYGWDYTTIKRKLEEVGIDWRNIKDRFNSKDDYITDEQITHARKLSSYIKAMKYLGCTYYKARRLLEADGNHVIIKTYNNKGKRWTYDIEVETHHNFIANGVCVHNSARDPNMMNIPARGDLSKMIKRLFVADEGCMYVKNDYSAHEVRDWANEAHDKKLASSFYVGLKYRQELRLLAYKFPEQAEGWLSHKKKHGWKEIQGEIKDKKITADEGFQKFQKVIKAVKDPITKKIAQAELELDIKGDIHKLNCQIFYKVPVLQVTDDQRQDVKAVVFGTIYGKTPGGLAISLKKTEEYAQELQDTLFSSFDAGAKWLHTTHESGQENLFVESPLGFRRHLWGYLHTRQGVVNAMNRRGPNSIIQGVASNIGIASIRIMQSLIWNYFIKQDIPFFWRSAINYIHDSVESETKTHLIPIYLYLIEHASTTLIHRRFQKVFGYNLDVGLELEFQVGASLDRVNKWSFMPSELFDTIENEMKWQQENLGYKYAKDTMQKVKHNWNIVSQLRRKELEESVKSKRPSDIMLLTEKNSAKMGFMI